MLTTKVITPKQGESYYAKENYYSTEECVEHSRWMGKGATKLGLKGKVKPKDFKKLLYGQLPNGTQFRTRKTERKGYKERAGLDCTFSAPKSFSLLLLAGGREELENAQQQAVLNTLKIIERDYATTRVCRDGKVKVVNTGNLVVALFHHDTSRELDPHRHTHCVILNMTEHDNRWYSLRNDDIHAHKKLLGMIYQNQLAIEVQKLGYEIEQKGHGQFEIKGFTEEQLQAFSKRRQQIKSQLGEESTWFEREKAWDKTRIAKGEPIPREELQEYWRKELEAQNVSYPQPTKGVGGRVSGVGRNQSQHPTPDTQYPKVYPLGQLSIDINQAVAEAIEHCSERTVAFKPEEIQKFVLTEVGKYQHQDLEQAITNNEELIHLDKQVTTQTALLREIATIKLVKDGQNKVKPLTNKEIVDEFIEGKNLTEGQRQAVTLASTTQDQIIAWQGKAGVGKTYALNEFKQIAEREGCIVKGFAPSAKAAKVLAEELNIKTTTVARQLVSHSWKDRTERQQIWIVDEAGLLGASDAYNLLKKAESENARVLLVGDTRQLSSVAAGNPFKSLQNAGIATAHLNQSLRQKTKDLKHAVDLLSDGKVAEGINVLETNQRILEIQDGQERANQIAIDYLSLSPDERKQTLIIAGTHQERESLIDSIREGLKQEGSLGEEVTTLRLKSKNLTNVQKKYAHYYEEGNVVIPLANYRRAGLEKNQQYRVQSVEGDSLVLVSQDGQEQRVSPASFKYKEVYEAIETNIAVGDRLRWGKNDKQLNRINGEEFVVTKIAEGIATIESETGKREQINLKTPQHLDHALVSTTYSSQGVTAKKVIVSVTNDLTLSQESFYVAASRAKYNLQFYVENKARLVEKAQSSRAQLNPLELIKAHRQKEAVVSTTTSTTKRSKQTINQIVQPNHDRNQTAEPNPQRDSDRNSRTNPPKTRQSRNQPQHPTRQFGIEPPKLKDRVSELSEGISSFVEQEEVEQLTESIESLNRAITTSFLSTGRTERLRNSIARLNCSITDYARKQDRRRGIEAIRDSIEESILESDPELIKAIEKLSQSLETRSNGLTSNRRQLQETINNYSHQLQQQPTLKNTADQLAQGITDYSEQLEAEEIVPSLTQFTTSLQEYVSNHSTMALSNLHHSIVKQQIMQNLDQLDRQEQETLKLKTEKLTEQLKQLDNNPKASKRKQQERKRDYYLKQLANINSYLQLSKGQKVTRDEQTGTITDLKLSPGGRPEAWVQWNSSSVPIPEQPDRLEVITQEIYQNIQEQDESTRNTQQSRPIDGENIGRCSILRAQTSSRETRPNRGQIDRPRVLSTPQTPTGRFNHTSPEVDQSVEPDRRKNRPTIREARPGIVGDVLRVDLSRRSLNRSNQEFGRSYQQLGHNNEQYGQVEQRFRRIDQQNGRVQQRFRRTNQQYGRVQQDFRELANQARNMPLEEVAQRLGLEPDRYDSNKYKSDAHIISINDQRFYDHLNLKGSGGAIDLVMHVQQSSFKEAVEWLNGNTIDLTPIKQANSFSKETPKPQPFEPPVPNESKWAAVKDYLVTTRKLPESTVDTLHQKGILYADYKQNAVFVRKDLEGEVKGASLRGTYNGSKFKGLAKGTLRDAGWFAFTKAKGEPERIVLVESPIDAISAAAIAQKKENTLFISTDGAGSIPHEFLKHELDKGKQVLVAYDNDEAGHTMARQVLDELPGAQRIKPSYGKDWNEQLIQSQNPVEQKKQQFRQEYERLRDMIHADPNLRGAKMEKVDITVAMRVIKEAVESGKSDNLLNRVGEVLCQSDRLKEWKQSLPEGEYQEKAKEYIIQTYERASLIRESILAERQRNQGIEFER